MASNCSGKKRKVTDEGRSFQIKWTNQYFFTEVNKKAVCLICSETVSVFKEYNIKRHYDTKHASSYDKFEGQFREDKASELKIKLSGQQLIFKNVSLQTESLVKASYAVAEIIAKKSKPFSDGEFVKECIESVADIICPDRKAQFAKLSLSRQTVARRIHELASNIERTLKYRATNFQFYSLALDESTDSSDTAQLAIFLRGVDKDFNITEELAALVPLKGTTKANDLMGGVTETLNRLGLKYTNLSGVTTDGAPAFAGKREGLVKLLQAEAAKVGNISVMQYHCLIHQENLCAKSLNLDSVLKVVVKVVNFIRSHGLRHREFKNFLQNLDSEFEDIVYYTEIRWLSRGNMLKRVFDLKNEIQTFMEEKGKPIVEFKDAEWMCDFAFLVDITTQLNELNSRLQGKDQLITTMFDHVKAFETKLRLWESQIKNNNFVHFPALQKCNNQNSQKYAEIISELRNEFRVRFKDFKENVISFNLFSSPFSINIDEVPEDLQMECVDFQCASDLKNKFNNVPLLEFYRDCFPREKYPGINRHALRFASLFGSTYICEQVFSRMKHVKCATRTRITDSHLESSLRVATTSIKPDIGCLVREKQCQVSH